MFLGECRHIPKLIGVTGNRPNPVLTKRWDGKTLDCNEKHLNSLSVVKKKKREKENFNHEIKHYTTCLLSALLD